VKWIQDYEDVFTELPLLGQKTWNDDEIKKRGFVHNAQNIGLVDTVIEELVSDKSFIETCNFFRSYAIRLDQQYKEKAARQIHNTSQLSNRSKKDKVKKGLSTNQ
jgi:UV DNA damage repair endonuclease